MLPHATLVRSWWVGKFPEVCRQLDCLKGLFSYTFFSDEEIRVVFHQAVQTTQKPNSSTGIVSPLVDELD